MSDRPSFISIEQAQKLVLDRVPPARLQRVRLEEACGRVLANPVVCDIDYPPFDKAMVDGYAIRSEDVKSGGVSLRVKGLVKAGQSPSRGLKAGEAFRINTGAPIPPDCDAVVPVEETELNRRGSKVRIQGEWAVERNVDRRGKYVSAGAVVLRPGYRLDAEGLAVAAAAGAAEVTVYRQPRVAILPTGDELVALSAKPKAGQIRNSNGLMLEALVRRAFAEPVNLGAARDQKKVLAERIRRGLGQADFLCVSGGVSMGSTDFVPEVLASCGVEFAFDRLAVKPGKPTMFGVGPGGVCVFALPGNPLAGFVVFELLVKPALAAREGRHGAFGERLTARLDGSVGSTAARQSYWPARVSGDGNGGLTARALSWSGSSDVFGFSDANGLIVRGAGAPAVETGESVSVMPLHWS